MPVSRRPVSSRPESDHAISRRQALITGAAAAATVAMPHYARAQGTGWSKLKGQSIVVNWPAHPHYAVAKKLLPDFTAATGIKVELDEMPYLRLKDAQVLQMGKPKGDYDVCVYVIMWKTEYVQRKFLTELEPMFQNADLAMPNYDRGDIIKGYYEGLGLVGGPRGYLPGPGAKLYGRRMVPNVRCSPIARISSPSTISRCRKPPMRCWPPAASSSRRSRAWAG